MGRIGPYVPDRGELVWLDFDPQPGREQKKRRPALVLSPKLYNEKTSLAIVCPLTSKIKGFPFEVVLSKKPASAVLADQVKSLDWRARNAKLISRISSTSLSNVLDKLVLLLSI